MAQAPVVRSLVGKASPSRKHGFQGCSVFMSWGLGCFLWEDLNLLKSQNHRIERIEIHVV